MVTPKARAAVGMCIRVCWVRIASKALMVEVSARGRIRVNERVGLSVISRARERESLLAGGALRSVPAQAVSLPADLSVPALGAGCFHAPQVLLGLGWLFVFCHHHRPLI